MVAGYGMSENTSHALFPPANGLQKEGSVGVPVANTHIQVLSKLMRRGVSGKARG